MAMLSRRAELWHCCSHPSPPSCCFSRPHRAGYVIAAVSWSVAVMQMATTLSASGIIRSEEGAGNPGRGGRRNTRTPSCPRRLESAERSLFDKRTTDSALDRGATLGRAVTYSSRPLELGAGLGSNRAMSVPFYVTQQHRTPRHIMFVYLLAKRISWPALRRDRSRSRRRCERSSAHPAAAFAGESSELLVSGAEITGAILDIARNPARRLTAGMAVREWRGRRHGGRFRSFRTLICGSWKHLRRIPAMAGARRSHENGKRDRDRSAAVRA